MSRIFVWVIAPLLFAVGVAKSALGQTTTGVPPFSSVSGGPFDVINNANLNVHFQIPVINKAGRTLPFYYLLSYDSSVWYPAGASGNQTWVPVTGWG
jgi:hypothetical protein